jgi:hypothetical protein
LREYHIYVSPKIFKNLRKSCVKFNHDKTKSDVFALGMVILEAGLSKSIQDVYDLQEGEISQYKLAELIDDFECLHKNNNY